ncbi:transcriptional regulator with XRE-family HTH domain [Brevundimonas bullata]|uniref:Transcriptional regulator with XRE-family HTH domain n=1 Tax=Brevundimonas bullata TaxID=13160 RepID=A0A7W7N2P6_9CAUL|nr:helix-turn-helix transcriptional regulator [Brevundimonas bullata]MBB4797555.1 transcriptional regulator with XRE-family HTH domain [Brevundimonas bullata]MBB6382515.1 transcriptional regulator with XRE-family HTH domain [Brevundimonas bullata]
MNKRSATALDVEIGQRLRKARMRCSLTQTGLAEAVGLSFQQVQKYEKGDNRLAISTLARMRPVLGIEAEDLLPPLRNDGSPIGDPLAAQGGTITGIQLARLFGQMRPDQQRAMLDIAKIVVSASAPETMAAA